MRISNRTRRLAALLPIALLCSLSVLIAFVPPPLEQEQHARPVKFCHPSHNAEAGGDVLCGNGKGTCIAGHGYEGCKDGDRMEETHLCSSFCWKEMCKCCQVLHRPKTGH